MSDIEKKIIKKLKELNFEKDDIVPTMLIVKDIEKYQIKLLEYLDSVDKTNSEELMNQIEKMGFLENNPNIE